MTNPPSTFDLDLEKLTYGGDAMGRLADGRAVFVPFALPGERVCIRLTEDVIPHLEAKPNVVLVDPPRAGLETRVVDGILTLDPRLIAYVSCNRSTRARDAARLIRGGYRLNDVTPFDLFPQTYHIESISLFER